MCDVMCDVKSGAGNLEFILSGGSPSFNIIFLPVENRVISNIEEDTQKAPNIS